MSDNLYNKLVEAWDNMSIPSLVSEEQVREALPMLENNQISNFKTICENYLKFEQIVLESSDEVLLERFAGDDQTIDPKLSAYPSGKEDPNFNPEATIGKPKVPTQTKKTMVSKLKEFVGKVKDIYTQLPKKKILIIAAAAFVISMLAPHFPLIGGLAKAAFGGFNVFKGGKGFWQEFNKAKGDRSNVKAVLGVLQAALGVFSGISGAENLAGQIANVKHQVASAAADAGHAATPVAPHVDAPAAPHTDAPVSAPTSHADAPSPDAQPTLLGKIVSTANSYADKHYGEFSDPKTQASAVSALKAKLDTITSLNHEEKKLLARRIFSALAAKGTYVPNGLERVGFVGH